MKKTFAACAALLMLLSVLTGCGSTAFQESEPPQDKEQTDVPDAPQSSTESSTGGKTLVAYYSATGNTKAVADVIADAAGADTFELTPTEPYTDADLDWRDDNSRCSLEYADPDLRNVELTASTVDNWADYDTVFIGYPIWWGIAAWPVDTFIKANDFSGKTVIPFCTSSSSGLGDSGKLLSDMAGTGNWQTGIRFRSGVSEADVRDWVNELGLNIKKA